jgi:hypothetical protein
MMVYVIENIGQLHDRLKSFSVDFTDLEKRITPDHPDAILLLTGTFAQGLATPTSDIDLLLVYPSDSYVHGFTASRTSETNDVYPLQEGDSVFPQDQGTIINRELSEGQKIQIYVTRADHITGVQNSVRARNDSFRARISGDHSRLRRDGRLLFFIDQLIMYRFYTGVVLHNTAGAEQIRNRLPLSELADNVAVRETSMIQGYFSDLRGLIAQSGQQEFETLLLIHQRMLVSLTVVLLAAVGEFCPQEKLLFRLLKRHAAAIGEDVVNDLLERFTDLERFVRSDALEINDFVYNVLMRARTKSPLVEAEYADWNKESVFATFVPFAAPAA